MRDLAGWLDEQLAVDQDRWEHAASLMVVRPGMLRSVAAQRQVVARHRDRVAGVCTECGSDATAGEDCPDVVELAEQYQDRDGYEEALADAP